MLVTGKTLVCSRCKKRLVTRQDKSRVFVETDMNGNLKLICPNCF